MNPLIVSGERIGELAKKVNEFFRHGSGTSAVSTYRIAWLTS